MAPVDDVLNVWVRTSGPPTSRPAGDHRHRPGRPGLLLGPRRRAGSCSSRTPAATRTGASTTSISRAGPAGPHAVRRRAGAAIVDEKAFPTTLLVGLNHDNPQLHDVYRLDLESGELEKVRREPRLRRLRHRRGAAGPGGLQPRPDGGMNLVGRRPGASAEDWEVSGGRLRRRPRHRPARLHRRRQRPLLLSSVDANASRLLQVDLASGGRTVLAEDPQYDVGGVMSHPDTRRSRWCRS